MAAETTVPMDDKDSWAAAMADEPTQVETPVEEAPVVEADQPRDEQGRFAPKQAETDAAPIQQPPVEAKTEPTEAKDAEGNVPSWRLREIREERDALARQRDEFQRNNYQTTQQMQALQRQLAELQRPKQEPVDFFTDPNAAVKQQLSPIEARFETLASQLTLRASRAENLGLHGKEKVSAMEKAIDAAIQSNHPDMPLLAQRMRQSDDPVGEAMKWFQQDSFLKETGGDLNAYKTKALDEALKDPAFRAKAMAAWQAEAQPAPGSTPNIKLPTSISKLQGSGVSHTAVDDGDQSDAGLFRHATAGMRR